MADEERLPCSVCKKACSPSSELTYHLLSHTVVELARALTLLQLRLATLEEVVDGKDEGTKVKVESVHAEDEDMDTNSNITAAKKSRTGPMEQQQKSRKRAEAKEQESGTERQGSRAPHPCTKCGAILSSRGALTKHLATHQVILILPYTYVLHIPTSHNLTSNSFILSSYNQLLSYSNVSLTSASLLLLLPPYFT